MLKSTQAWGEVEQWKGHTANTKGILPSGSHTGWSVLFFTLLFCLCCARTNILQAWHEDVLLESSSTSRERILMPTSDSHVSRRFNEAVDMSRTYGVA